jgi:hypothetical protein
MIDTIIIPANTSISISDYIDGSIPVGAVGFSTFEHAFISVWYIPEDFSFQGMWGAMDLKMLSEIHLIEEVLSNEIVNVGADPDAPFRHYNDIIYIEFPELEGVIITLESYFDKFKLRHDYMYLAELYTDDSAFITFNRDVEMLSLNIEGLTQSTLLPANTRLSLYEYYNLIDSDEKWVGFNFDDYFHLNVSRIPDEVLYHTLSRPEVRDISEIYVSSDYRDALINEILTQEAEESSIIGTWECHGTGSHFWICNLVISEDGRFIDADGDVGSWSILGDVITFDFDYFETLSFEFIHDRNVLTFPDFFGAPEVLNRR